jgi:hypothetical protein
VVEEVIMVGMNVNLVEEIGDPKGPWGVSGVAKSVLL